MMTPSESDNDSRVNFSQCVNDGDEAYRIIGISDPNDGPRDAAACEKKKKKILYRDGPAGSWKTDG